MENVSKRVSPAARPPIIAVVATSQYPRQGIGFKNDLPWPRVKADMAFFKELTSGHIVVMGRKTAESLPKALPNRQNFVLSRDRNYSREGFIVVNHIDEVIQQANTFWPDKKIYVIGGAEIYELLQPYVDELYQTVIPGSYDCDTFFPENFVPGNFVQGSVIHLTTEVHVLVWIRPPQT